MSQFSSTESLRLRFMIRFELFAKEKLFDVVYSFFFCNLLNCSAIFCVFRKDEPLYDFV